MKEKFWKFMDSARGFWSLILVTIVAGVAYMLGTWKLIDWIRERGRK